MVWVQDTTIAFQAYKSAFGDENVVYAPFLYEVPEIFSIEIGPFELDYGRFLFEAPPIDGVEFDYTKEADTGENISVCRGTCRNAEGVDDYFGIAVIDKDTNELVCGYYTDIKIPLYNFVAWATKQNQVMPNHDWNLICYVGYYRVEESVLHATDWREFTIKSLAEKKFPYWILLLAAPLLLVTLIKKK